MGSFQLLPSQTKGNGAEGPWVQQSRQQALGEGRPTLRLELSHKIEDPGRKGGGGGRERRGQGREVSNMAYMKENET